jgi:hypothetical protein
VLALLFASALGSAAAEKKILTDCAAVRDLPKEVAEQRLPVRIRGVVTFSYPKPGTAFVIQSGGQGTYVERGEFARSKGLIPAPWSWPDIIPPGSVVELDGVTGPGDYAPVIYPQHIRIVGQEPLPPATPLPISDLLDSKWDCQLVRVRGVVQFAEATPQAAQSAWCTVAASACGSIGWIPFPV